MRHVRFVCEMDKGMLRDHPDMTSATWRGWGGLVIADMLTMSAKNGGFYKKTPHKRGVGGRPASADRWLTEGVGGSEIPKCWLTSYLDGPLQSPVSAQLNMENDRFSAPWPFKALLNLRMQDANRLR